MRATHGGVQFCAGEQARSAVARTAVTRASRSHRDEAFPLGQAEAATAAKELRGDTRADMGATVCVLVEQTRSSKMEHCP